MLVSASDEELIEKLVAVRGLGRWSVEMFACFGLKRMDVFSTGDLGVQYVDSLLLLFFSIIILFWVEVASRGDGPGRYYGLVSVGNKTERGFHISLQQPL